MESREAELARLQRSRESREDTAKDEGRQLHPINPDAP
jgi:hypothetical protein